MVDVVDSMVARGGVVVVYANDENSQRYRLLGDNYRDLFVKSTCHSESESHEEDPASTDVCCLSKRRQRIRRRLCGVDCNSL